VDDCVFSIDWNQLNWVMHVICFFPQYQLYEMRHSVLVIRYTSSHYGMFQCSVQVYIYVYVYTKCLKSNFGFLDTAMSQVYIGAS